jgi:Undecaprenyl-phosphate glucose phosphotransferase
MLRSHHHFFRLLYQIMDALTVIGSWWLAYWLRFINPPSFLGPAPEFVQFRDYLPLTIALVFIWYLSLQISGAYKSWRTSKFGNEILTVLKASLIGFLFISAATLFLARETYSRAALGFYLVFVTLFLVIARYVLHRFVSSLRAKGMNQKKLLLVGDGILADQFIHRLQGRPELGYTLAGFVRVGEDSKTLKNFGSIDSLERVLTENNIQQVVVCLKNQDMPRLNPILKEVGDLNVQVRIVPDVVQYAILGFEVEVFDGLPILSLNESPLLGWNAVLKRITDIVYSSGLLLAFSPVMLTIAAIVKLTSKGPILYGQERMGLDGRTFKMYKFRSMRTDAEDETGAVWARAGDDRVTWIGGILRKTSLDELPQFFNVLKGDMSCVGPRPERPVFVEKFRKEIPSYMLRHKVKAGITGWAQINGLRGNTSLEDRIKYDIHYISNWSILFDLRIMFLTVFKGFISPNAY